MSKQTDKGKGVLKEKLAGYQVDPPSSVWHAISGQLGGLSSRRIILISLASAASIALAVTLGINFFGPDLPRDAEISGMEEESGQGTHDQVPALEQPPQVAVQELSKESASNTQRETLEEKVVRTMESLKSEDLASEVVIAEAAASEDVIAEAAASEDVIAEATASEDVIAEAVASEDVIDDAMATEDVIAEATASEVAVSDTQELTPVDGDVNAVSERIASGEDGSVELEAGIDLIPEPGDESPKKDPRWIIGAALSPLYSFRDAEPKALAATPDHESGMISYAGGVQVGYRTTRRLAIESGIFFNKMGISIGAPGIQLFQPAYDFAPLGAEAARSNVMAVSNTVGNIVSKSGEIYVNNYKLNATQDNLDVQQFDNTVYADQGIRQHLDYLEVPLNLRYTLVDRSLEIQLVGGMSTNLLVNNYVTMETADGTTEVGYLTNIRNVNYSGNAGIGLVYHIMEHFSLNLEPRFRYFLNSVNDATLPSTRPYTFGFYTGLNYLF